MLRNIDRQRWEVLAVGITRDGRWLLCHEDITPDAIADGSWEKDPDLCHVLLSPDRQHDAGQPGQPLDGAVLPVPAVEGGEDGVHPGPPPACFAVKEP